MALVDARRGRIEDHEHLGREVLAATVEDDARHVDRRRIVGSLVQVELQRREPVLPVDDQEFGRRLVHAADAAVAAGAESEPLGGEQQYRARDRRLRGRWLVEGLWSA